MKRRHIREDDDEEEAYAFLAPPHDDVAFRPTLAFVAFVDEVEEAEAEAFRAPLHEDRWRSRSVPAIATRCNKRKKRQTKNKNKKKHG